MRLVRFEAVRTSQTPRSVQPGRGAGLYAGSHLQDRRQVLSSKTDADMVRGGRDRRVFHFRSVYFFSSATCTMADKVGDTANSHLVAALATKKEEKPREPLSETLRKAGKRALGGDLPGAAAMVMQVSTLMWLRTTMNYQYRHGTTTREALRHLYRDGGVVRFYRGYFPALLQGPISRFGETASNAGMLALLESFDSTRNLPTGLKTMSASAVAASFRLFLMPIDTVKTIVQVEGTNGIPALRAKFKISGPSVFFQVLLRLQLQLLWAISLGSTPTTC